MKLFVLLIAFLSCSSAKIVAPGNESFYLARATHKIVEIMSRQYGVSTVNLISPMNDFMRSDFHNEIMSGCAKYQQIHFRVEATSEQLSKIQGRRKRFSIISIKNFREFLVIHKKVNRDDFHINGYFLIILINGSSPEIERMWSHLWKSNIFNVNFMSLTKQGTIKIETFFPFKPDHCHNSTQDVINEFKNGSFIENGYRKLFPAKTNNLYKCSVRVATSNDSGPFAVARRQPNGSYALSGRDLKLIEMLAESLNFKSNYSYIGATGVLHDNGTGKGPLRALIDNKAEIASNEFWLKASRLKFLDASTSYIGDLMIFLVPPGREFTWFEKLLQPFEALVWSLIAVVFITGAVVIRVVSSFSKQIQSFVFGTNVHSPYLNFYIAFIGGYQPILPRRNFARYLLMMILMYSLVIRTLYQASYYKFLQSDEYNSPVASVDEMVEKDFTFYGTQLTSDIFWETRIMRNR